MAQCHKQAQYLSTAAKNKISGNGRKNIKYKRSTSLFTVSTKLQNLKYEILEKMIHKTLIIMPFKVQKPLYYNPRLPQPTLRNYLKHSTSTQCVCGQNSRNSRGISILWISLVRFCFGRCVLRMATINLATILGKLNLT